MTAFYQETLKSILLNIEGWSLSLSAGRHAGRSHFSSLLPIGVAVEVFRYRPMTAKK